MIIDLIENNRSDLKGFLKKIIYKEIEFDWDEYFNLYERYLEDDIVAELTGAPIDDVFNSDKILINSFNELEISLKSRNIHYIAKGEEVIENLEILLQSFEDLLSKYNESKKNINKFFN